MVVVKVPSQTCVRCSSTDVRSVPFVSLHTPVDYYGCGACGHIWTTPKSEGGATRQLA